jgi:hypothetical protein
VIVAKLETIYKRVRCAVKKVYYFLKYNKKLKIGKNVLFYKNFFLFASGYLTIGDN